MILRYMSLPCLPYHEALTLQQRLVEKRQRGDLADTLLLLEHPPVITLGRRDRRDHVLVDHRREGVDVVKTTRGGEATYHGPGQLIGYLIVDLRNHGGVKQFVMSLEECLSCFLKEEYHVDAARDPTHRGVWVDKAKIAAIGLAISRQITMHGFALNISPRLEHFSWIIPCGIPGGQVTSLEKETGEKKPLSEVKRRLLPYVLDTFRYASIEEAM